MVETDVVTDPPPLKRNAGKVATFKQWVILEREMRHPSSPDTFRLAGDNRLGQAPVVTTFAQILSQHKPGRNKSPLAHLSEDAVHFALRGKLPPHPVGPDRRIIRNMIGKHAPAFRAAFAFPVAPQGTAVAKNTLMISAEAWKTRYLQAARAQLWPLLLQAVNHLGDAQKARELLKSEEEQQRATGRALLGHLKAYQDWLRTSWDSSQQTDFFFGDHGVRRADALLRPILARWVAPRTHLEEATRRKASRAGGEGGEDAEDEEDEDAADEDEDEDDDSAGKVKTLPYFIKARPVLFFGAYLAVLSAVAQDDTLKKCRPCGSFPVRRSFIPVHVAIAADGLAALRSDVVYNVHSARTPGETLDSYKARREEERRSAWATVFDMSCKAFGKPDPSVSQWAFGTSVRTDGVSLAVMNLKIVASVLDDNTDLASDVSSDLTELTELSELSQLSDSQESAAARLGDAFPPNFALFHQLEADSILAIATDPGPKVFCDPGKRNLLPAVSNISTPEKRQAFSYAAADRARHLNTAGFAKRREQCLRALPPHLKAAKDAFDKVNKVDIRRFDGSNSTQWLELFQTFFPVLTAIYSQLLFRNLRMQAFSLRQREEARFIRNVSSTFGNEAIFIFGSWKGMSLKGSPSSLGRPELQKLLVAYGFRTQGSASHSSWGPEAYSQVKL
ncbi:hypothetical protein OC844_007354 [Tilletia horrida]|nr:hypothetical protein OC844_007354 [Tilletia horrida]